MAFTDNSSSSAFKAKIAPSAPSALSRCAKSHYCRPGGSRIQSWVSSRWPKSCLVLGSGRTTAGACRCRSKNSGTTTNSGADSNRGSVSSVSSSS
ncbi:hypothetical protein BDD12DRAFT_836934 [Trichophaea hybrida]|nr:hypothetical protein BDD12DRAFT_836934 [Trichophaea hybrida]